MRTLYSHCPNPDCRYRTEQAPARWYQKWGYFKDRENGKLIPRYRCKTCRKCFSASTFKVTYRQRRADINETLRRQYSEGMGIRPAARSLQVSKTTILRKLKFLGELSKAAIDDMLDGGEIKTSYVQFDEMMAFERTQCLPMTVSIAVRPKDGILISARAGSIPCNTGLKDISLRNYGPRKDEREKVVRQMLRDIAKCVRDQKNFTIASDADWDYKDWVEKELPFASYEKHVGEDLKRREKAMKTVDLNLLPVDYSTTDTYGPLYIKRHKNGNIVKKAYDPLFAVNQKCMKLRASLSRLRRDFWGYTQKQENLQYHLWIFMAYHNGWKLPTRKIQRKPQKTEPKVYPTPDLTSVEAPSLPTPKVQCTYHRQKTLLIPAAFMGEHGLHGKARFRSIIDLEKKVMKITFHNEGEPDTFKFSLSGKMGCPYLGTIFRRNDLKVTPGRVSLQWDAERQCLFVFFGDLLEKKNV